MLLAIARELGWPARYVSGYLVPEAGAAEGESHAWVEICSAGGDWLGYDPTHGGPAGPELVAVAVSRDYSDAAPVRGSFVSAAPGLAPEVIVLAERQSLELALNQ